MRIRDVTDPSLAKLDDARVMCYAMTEAGLHRVEQQFLKTPLPLLA
jgi:hypothetical protein